MQFKSAVLNKLNKDLELKYLEIPRLKSGQVLVKIIYSSLCHSQIQEIYGGRNNNQWIPHLLGHEGLGIVKKIGRNVSKVKKEDKVILTWQKNSGLECSNICYYDSNNKRYSAGKVTTFNEYAVISENRLLKKNKNINDIHASFFACAFSTGLGMVLSNKKFNKNSKIALIGFGGIGFFTLLSLKYMGVKNVTIIDIDKKKLEIARKIIDGDFLIFNKIKKKISNFDYCFESSGKTEAIEFGMKILKKDGKCIFASHPPKEQTINIYPHDLISGKEIKGIWGSHVGIQKAYPLMIKIYKKYSKYISNTFTDVYEFENINKAIYDFRSKKSFRPIIKFIK